MTFIIAVLVIVAITGTIAVIRTDGGPARPRSVRDCEEWSTSLPSHQYAARFNQQFTSAWTKLFTP